MPAIDIDRDAAREAAQHELAKPIYPKGELSHRVMDELGLLLQYLLVRGSMVPGGWFTLSVLAVVVVAAAVVAIRIARRSMRTDRGNDIVLFGPTDLSAAEHRAVAERGATAGDWAAAVRHRLRAVARQLEEYGVLHAAPGRTASELARDAGSALPQLAAEFDAAAAIFNDVSYGHLPATPDGYRLIADLDDHLRSRSPAGVPPPVPQGHGGWAPVR